MRRSELGLDKYRETLQAHTGRNGPLNEVTSFGLRSSQESEWELNQ